MTKSKDCPLNSNNELRAEFVDCAQVEHLSDLDRRLKRTEEWLSKLPASEAHNASRLHSHNLANRVEVFDLIDDHRKTPDGREKHNQAQRKSYAEEKGTPVRPYARGLSKAEREKKRRDDNKAQKAAKWSIMTEEERVAVRKANNASKAKARQAKKDREAAEAAAMIEARRIF